MGAAGPVPAWHGRLSALTLPLPPDQNPACSALLFFLLWAPSSLLPPPSPPRLSPPLPTPACAVTFPLVLAVGLLAEGLNWDSWTAVGWAALMYGPILLVTVLLHELGHCLATRRLGGQVEGILLWPLGGLAYLAHASGPKGARQAGCSGWAGLQWQAGGQQWRAGQQWQAGQQWREQRGGAVMEGNSGGTAALGGRGSAYGWQQLRGLRGRLPDVNSLPRTAASPFLLTAHPAEWPRLHRNQLAF